MKNDFIYNVIVIGAGAAGLYFGATAGGAAEASMTGAACASGATGAADGLILEKTGRAGAKLLLSGGGRCNITHAGDIKDFVSRYGENGKAIRRVLYKHSNLDLMKWLAENGIDTAAEDDGRIFPASKNAADVLDFLLSKCSDNGLNIKYNSEVTAIERDDDLWIARCASGAAYKCRNVVIATGGASFPKTGSDGTFFDVLKRDLDINITSLTPALSPLQIKYYPYAELSGLSVDGAISARGKKSEGAILFTHQGISGPAAINISGSLAPGDEIKVNYIYPVDYEHAFKKIQAATVGNKAQLATIIAETFDLPKRMCKIFADRSSGSTKALAHLLTENKLIVSDCGNFDVAMATRGGIALPEVNLSTMELNHHPGIYAVGEALDVDGETGGYNLQFAYSSARLAADSIKKN